MSRIVVTGIGIISAIGSNTAENHTALVQGKTGIGMLDSFPSRYAGLLPFGGAAISNDILKERLLAEEPGITRTTLLALQAFNEAVADAQLVPSQLQEPGTALVGASTVGGMCLTDQLYHDANTTGQGSPYLSSYDCASVSLYLQQRYGITGIINTINTACSSSANAILYGARLIRHGLAERAVVGGADSLAKFTINGFNALHILSPEQCMPFDENRKGLNLGEGAAFLVLEKEDNIAGKKIYARLAGYCNANDAFHPSSLSEEGDGPFLSMQGALANAGITARDIDFIHAHGTGTENNDLVESRAMLRLFEPVPAFASTKSYTGHTLGAAGAIGAVYSVLNLQHQEMYPAVHFAAPIAATGLQPVMAYRKMPLRYVMSNSFGFGGNCTSLVFAAG